MGSVSTNIRVLIATVLTSIGYYFASIQPTANIAYDLFIIVVSILLSGALSSFLISGLNSFRWGRALLMQSAYVEGYWYWYTTGDFEPDSPLARPGLMYLHYTGENLDLRGIVMRSDPTTGKYNQSSHSDIALVRNSDGRYLNYGFIPNKSKERKFIAAGKFFRSNPGAIPDTYEGSIILEHVDSEMLQRGRKIPHREVEEFRKEHGESWVAEILKVA